MLRTFNPPVLFENMGNRTKESGSGGVLRHVSNEVGRELAVL